VLADVKQFGQYVATQTGFQSEFGKWVWGVYSQKKREWNSMREEDGVGKRIREHE
jgi:adenosyl cobinamide kinase/adenosyl cobinamide phosphate guanylyltransferase